VFRELLQLSDDAGARSVEIRFETEEYLSREEDDNTQSDESEQGDLPDLKTVVARCFMLIDGRVLIVPYDYSQVHHWTFKNNGILFGEEDWSRLKKIGA
jgi:hypothetical protein